MKRLLPLLLAGLVACDQPATEPTTEPTTEVRENVTWTKTMEYAVDLNSVFHQNLDDEDFSDVSPLTAHLISNVISGKLTAYDRSSDMALTIEQVKTILAPTDTIWFEEPETGDRRMEIIDRDYTSDFYGFTFREKWSYDEKDAIVGRSVVGIAPRIPVYSSNEGILRGYTSAFWVKYE